MIISLYKNAMIFLIQNLNIYIKTSIKIGKKFIQLPIYVLYHLFHTFDMKMLGKFKFNNGSQIKQYISFMKKYMEIDYNYVPIYWRFILGAS